MAQYSPVSIQVESENIAKSDERIYRALRCVQKYCPCLVSSQIPHGRASVNSQLRNRRSFPSGDWRECGIPERDLLSVLRVIQREMNHPNHHYTPKDPMALLLIEEYEGALDQDSVRLGIREKFGLNIGLPELAEACLEKGWTIEDLVKFVLENRVRSSSSERPRLFLAFEDLLPNSS